MKNLIFYLIVGAFVMSEASDCQIARRIRNFESSTPKEYVDSIILINPQTLQNSDVIVLKIERRMAFTREMHIVILERGNPVELKREPDNLGINKILSSFKYKVIESKINGFINDLKQLYPYYEFKFIDLDKTKKIMATEIPNSISAKPIKEILLDLPN